jgi:hypothetical protein
VTNRIRLFFVPVLLVLSILFGACGDNTSVSSNQVAVVTPTISQQQGVSLLASIGNLKKLEVDPSIGKGLLTTFPKVDNGQLDFYTSGDAQASVASTIHNNLKNSGYTISYPQGATQPAPQNGGLVGIYTKASAPDIFVSISGTSLFENYSSYSVPGASTVAVEGFVNQVKGSKSLMAMVTASGLLSAVNTPVKK